MPASGLRDRAVRIGAVNRSEAITVAKAVKQIAQQEARRVTGGDQRLDGKKRRGIRLRARDDIRHAGAVTTIRVQGLPVGPWVWVNTGTAPHDIRRRKRGPLRNMTVAHPGTSGKQAWRRTVRRSATVVPSIYRTAIARAVS